MKKKKPEDVAVEAVNDLFIRDIEKLLFDHKKYDIASHLMKSMGMNKKEINKIINEVKGVQRIFLVLLEQFFLLLVKV
jgi:hypothetical protein